MRENDFYIFVSSDLDLWPLDLKFAPLVTLVQGDVTTKLTTISSRSQARVYEFIQIVRRCSSWEERFTVYDWETAM